MLVIAFVAGYVAAYVSWLLAVAMVRWGLA